MLMNPAEKVRSLLKLAAEGSGATPEEAANAAVAAQRIITKYNVDLAEVMAFSKENGTTVEVEEIEREIYWPGQRAAKWEAMLGYYLAPTFSCRSFNSLGSGLFVVGRKTNREAFIATFLWLQGQIAKMAKTLRPAHIHPRQWNNSFGIGAVQTIRERIGAETKEIEATDPGTAIVLRNAITAVDEFVTASIKFKNASPVRISSGTGYEAGRVAGSAINIGRATPGQKQLAA